MAERLTVEPITLVLRARDRGLVGLGFRRAGGILGMRLVPLAQRSDIAHVVGVYAALSVHPDVLAGTVPPGGLAEVADRRAVVPRLPFLAGRSEDRRVGKECVSTCRY